jgi:protein phosphatase 1 regulatory subunit 11
VNRGAQEIRVLPIASIAMSESRRRAARVAGRTNRGRAGGAQADRQPTGTMTVTTVAPEGPPVLRLELAPRRVRWTPDTHDNEHDGGRTSKSCCIYHRPRRFDESSTESSADESENGESSSSSSDSDGDRETGECSHTGADGRRRRGGRRKHRHDGNGAEEQSDGSSSSDGGQVRRPARREVPSDDCYAAPPGN